MDDEQTAQYYVTLGNSLELARLGRLRIEVELDDGVVLGGVPESSPIALEDQQIDHTGVSPYAEIDGDVVMLEHVRSYRVFRPE